MFNFFSIFCLKRGVLKSVPFFLRFLGRPELSTGRAHMQSVHAGAVQTHFFSFALFLKNSSLGSSFWVHLESHFPQKSQFWVKKRCSKNCFKKSDPPQSNKGLLTCREAPGEAASRTRFLSKKQLSGQQTTTTAHFWVNFWAVVLEWVISESMSGKLLTFWWNLKQKKRSNCRSFCSLYLFQRVVIWHALGQGPANFI